MITVLLAFVCTTAAMDNCSVWQEGKWAGPAASVYCTVERDLAEAKTPPGAFIRYECDSYNPEEIAHADR